MESGFALTLPSLEKRLTKCKCAIKSLVSTPNCNPFLKYFATISCLNCTSYIYKSPKSILDLPIFTFIKDYKLFKWCQKNAYYKNLKSYFCFQKDPTKIQTI